MKTWLLDTKYKKPEELLLYRIQEKKVVEEVAVQSIDLSKEEVHGYAARAVGIR